VNGLKLSKTRDGSFIVTSNKGTLIHASVVAIAGLGSFEPRKPLMMGSIYEDKGVKYSSKTRKNLEIKESLCGRWRLCLDLSIFLQILL
jgi:thioredoxin reductase (NADPH)